MRVTLLLACFMLAGCTDAARSSLASYGSKHKIELYSGGQMVREWTSTGKVVNEQDSDGYYFCDAETNVVVRVTGDLVITPISK